MPQKPASASLRHGAAGKSFIPTLLPSYWPEPRISQKQESDVEGQQDWAVWIASPTPTLEAPVHLSLLPGSGLRAEPRLHADRNGIQPGAPGQRDPDVFPVHSRGDHLCH